MRLIDADKLEVSKLCNAEYGTSEVVYRNHVAQMIDDAPTIEPKKGEWIHEGHDAYNNYYRCSNCRHLFGDNGRKHDPYCSHCGAYMRGETNDIT